MQFSLICNHKVLGFVFSFFFFFENAWSLVEFQGDKTKAVFDTIGDANKVNMKYFFSLTRHIQILNKNKLIYKTIFTF